MTSVILIIFVVGYIAIALEHVIHIHKTASALIAGVLCWVAYILNHDPEFVVRQLHDQLSDIAGILFFLLGAMTIVKLIDAHDGFTLVHRSLKAGNYRRLLWIICLVTFFLSALLDNLTTAIVMVTITQKMIRDPKYRLYFTGMIVIAANAGGVWSPIGDVTTTMLWIGGQISTFKIIFSLFLPSLCCIAVPLFIASKLVNWDTGIIPEEETNGHVLEFDRNFIFFSGIGILILVPFVKSFTGLPPYMAILLGMGILWMLTGFLHKNKDKRLKYSLSVSHALKNIDIPSILFFLGILLAVGALRANGQLQNLAENLNSHFPNKYLMLSIIGLASSVVDNVPLVAAIMGMYPLSVFPIDDSFWLFFSYCAGTGGSLLIIGSAAGIAAMGIGEVSFGWYLKKMSWLALIGFVAGIGVFLLQELV